MDTGTSRIVNDRYIPMTNPYEHHGTAYDAHVERFPDPDGVSIPEQSLAALLGARLQMNAIALKEKHRTVPGTGASGLKFFRSRKQALASRYPQSTEESTEEKESGTDRISQGVRWPEYGGRSPLPRPVHQYPATTLDGTRRAEIARKLNIALPVVRIHHHYAARQLVKRQKADAVAVGREVFVRSPQSINGPEGTALLGHELTHAAQEYLRPRSRAGTITEERVRELTALTHERQLRGSSVPPQGPAHPPVPITQLSVRASEVPIRAARQGRQLSQNENSGSAPAPVALDGRQMQKISETVYRDLMLRVREEFERGG